MKLDPRISDLYRRETPGVRLLAMAVFSMIPAAQQSEIIESFGGRGIDTQGSVAGKPFLHWMGKSRNQIRRERVTDDQMREIEDAFKDRGLQLDPEPSPTQPASARNAGNKSNARNAGKKSEGEDAPPEPTFGGFKLSELAGKSDKELLAIEGIGPATVLDIRKAQEANG